MTKFVRHALFTSRIISSSLDSFCGSKLNLRVPSKIVGSWGMIVIQDQSLASSILEMSSPLINICPEYASTIRHRARHIVLLPAPVLPTIPTFSPAFTSNVKSFRTSSVSGQYLRWKFLNSTVPIYGQEGRTFFPRLNFSDSISMIF